MHTPTRSLHKSHCAAAPTDSSAPAGARPLTLSLSRKAGQSHLASLPWRRRIFARGAAEDAEVRDSCRGGRQVARLSVAPGYVTSVRFVHGTGDLPVAPTRIFATSAAPREHTRPPGKDDPTGDGQSPYAIALPARGEETLLGGSASDRERCALSSASPGSHLGVYGQTASVLRHPEILVALAPRLDARQAHVAQQVVVERGEQAATAGASPPKGDSRGNGRHGGEPASAPRRSRLDPAAAGPGDRNGVIS